MCDKQPNDIQYMQAHFLVAINQSAQCALQQNAANRQDEYIKMFSHLFSTTHNNLSNIKLANIYQKKKKKNSNDFLFV